MCGCCKHCTLRAMAEAAAVLIVVTDSPSTSCVWTREIVSYDQLVTGGTLNC